jgi:hypothetical protein
MSAAWTWPADPAIAAEASATTRSARPRLAYSETADRDRPRTRPAKVATRLWAPPTPSAPFGTRSGLAILAVLSYRLSRSGCPVPGAIACLQLRRTVGHEGGDKKRTPATSPGGPDAHRPGRRQMSRGRRSVASALATRRRAHRQRRGRSHDADVPQGRAPAHHPLPQALEATHGYRAPSPGITQITNLKGRDAPHAHHHPHRGCAAPPLRRLRLQPSRTTRHLVTPSSRLRRARPAARDRVVRSPLASPVAAQRRSATSRNRVLAPCRLLLSQRQGPSRHASGRASRHRYASRVRSA